MIGCFVTGTDTGVGKTLVSTGLLHALAPHHRRVVGMKPVAAGVVPWGEDWASEDAIALRSASTLAVAPELDNPVLLLDPLSPHIAAERAGVQIDIAAIVRSYQALAAQADAVVVEGAGGFHVPLTDTQTGADLAQALALPVVLVVGSGSMTHNLAEFFGGAREPAPYVLEFSRWIEAALERADLPALLAYRNQSPHADRAHPTEDHFLPLFFALGAAGDDLNAQYLSREVMYSMLAMNAFALQATA